MNPILRWVCAGCNDVSTLRDVAPEEGCMVCGADEWREDGPPQWGQDKTARIAELETALGWFLRDNRFRVAVGGNPNVVDAMLGEARRILGEPKA